jgi:hypothetical protein
MINILIHYLLLIFAWLSIYPLALVLGFLFDSDASQELFWQFQFESHYLLALHFIRDFSQAALLSSIWLLVVFIFQILRKTSFKKFANGLLLVYPFILIAVILINDLPDLLWQMSAIAWVLNLFILSNRK